MASAGRDRSHAAVVYLRREYFLLRTKAHLRIGRAPVCRFLLRGFAAVEAMAGSPAQGPASQSRISTSLLVPAGTIELIEDRHDLLTVFGIWILVQSGIEQREVFGAKVFLQFVYLLGQILGPDVGAMGEGE
jgi:hypothetical protein